MELWCLIMATNYKEKTVDGFKVFMCLTEEEGLSVEDGGKWVLICEEHGGLIQDSNKTRLWQNADEVADWCGVHQK